MFARRLQPGRRTVDAAPHAVVSPCDGKVAASGQIASGTLIQAKGREYSVSELVADDALAQELQDGQFFTVYLLRQGISPRSLAGRRRGGGIPVPTRARCGQ